MMIRFQNMSFDPLLLYKIKILLFFSSTVKFIFREKNNGENGLAVPLFSLTCNLIERTKIKYLYSSLWRSPSAVLCVGLEISSTIIFFPRRQAYSFEFGS